MPDELESQIAKIQLGNFKYTSSFVYVLAEKAAASEAELYVVAELPMLNPAAQESCEKICMAIASALRRVYKKPLLESSFETAIAQINEELGKLASMGQVHWINHLNCIIAVKEYNNFTIATCGKIAAFLFRNKEFTDISCSANSQSHPLKTFENYSSGKIRLNDVMILSTTQLFNYISMDRVKTLLSGGEFLRATQTIIELLKENAGPEAAFGTIFNMQVRPGQTSDEEVDLEDYVLETQADKMSIIGHTLGYLKTMFAFDRKKRLPQTSLPGWNASGKITNLKNNAQAVVAKSKNFWTALGRGLATSRGALKPENFKQFSPQKKFFIICAAILALAVITNLAVAAKLRTSRKHDDTVAGQLKSLQDLLNNSQTSLLYGDENAAENYLSQTSGKLPNADQISKSNKALYESVSKQLSDLEKKLGKETEAEVSNIGALGSGGSLLKLPNLLGVQSNGNIISYSKTTGRVEDGNLKAADVIVGSVYINNNLAVIHNGTALRLWDFSTAVLTAPFNSSVPQESDWAGLAAYPTNSRVYLINKKTGQIVNFLVAGNNISKPVVSITDDSLKSASDLTIDSAIYVLNDDGNIKKFQSGKAAEFKMPFLNKTISENGKIYTEKDWQYLYVLDPGSNRILILDKKGSLISTLQNNQFTKLVDFQVDEKGKTIYVLNDSSLLKVVIP